MTKNDMINIIYDTLMNNKGNRQFDTYFVENNILDNTTNTITFSYGSGGNFYKLSIEETEDTED
jgi:hypothetical protein